jgi:restriction system protein
MHLVAKLPWWVGVVLAGVSYLVLHQFAAPAAAAAVQTSRPAALILPMMVAAVANIAQYLIPVLFIAGAGLSFFRGRKRQSLVANVAQAKSADALDGMSWQEFEMLVGEAFRLQGFSVAETGGGGADGGVDLVLTKGSEKFLVQCKQWKAYKVGVEIVRELYGVMAAKGATGGFVVTSGSYTKDAQEFAAGRNVKLVDGERLFGLLKQAKQSLAKTEPKPQAHTTVAPARSEPTCPVCASSMLLRTAKKGANAGSQFWGCSKYPGCRGTRAIS